MVRPEQLQHAKRFLQSALEQGIRDEFKFMLENDEDGLFSDVTREDFLITVKVTVTSP